MAKKFELKTEKLTIRDEEFTVRELKHGERVEMFRIRDAESHRLAAFVISKACVDPTYTEAEVNELPGEMAPDLTRAIFRLSGLAKTEEKKDSATSSSSTAESP